jgi:UDP-glucose 4-epimerase
VRVLVTGGAGYIGSVVVEELLTAGADRVVVVDDLSTGHEGAVVSPATLTRGDIADQPLVEKLCRGERIDAVVHMAASSLVAQSVADPARYYDDNVTKGLRLLEALRSAGVERIVFSSTAAVYEGSRGGAIDELAPTVPGNPYGDTKLAFERALSWYDPAYGMKSISLRYFNAAGATLRNGVRHVPETHLIPLVLDAARGARPAVQIYGDDYPTADGTCIRDYVHVSDVARAHVIAIDHLVRRAESGVYNVGSGGGYSVRQVIDTARAVTGRPIQAIAGARRAGDAAVLVASCARIRQMLGWAPTRQDLTTIIGDAWHWIQRYPAGYSRDA